MTIWRGVILEGGLLRVARECLDWDCVVPYEVPDDEAYAAEYGLAHANELAPGVAVTFEWEGEIESRAVELRIAPAELEQRVAKLRAVGLFLDLDESAPPPEQSEIDDDLAARIDEHFTHGDRRDFAVRAPQSMRALAPLKLAGVRVWDDPRRRSTAWIETNGRARAFAPKTHADWAEVLNETLRAANDERRFVPLQTIDWEEPLYLLVTPAQDEALSAAGLEHPMAESGHATPIELGDAG